ncbi:MAG: nitrate- and nitrite sensing domain-containing protein [Pseudomonadales bacterium]|nr:nitrate- and nitrite sensing domain-containing protein [Pseudomonadales bacterium]
MSFSIQSLTLAIITFTALIILIYISHTLTTKRERKRAKEGVQYLEALTHVLTSIQRHRGASNGYLNGDENLKSRIPSLQSEVEQHLINTSKISPWIIDNERYSAIKEHWGRLSNSYIRLEPGNCLEQHNTLIKNVLFLIEDCAETHHLHELILTDNRQAAYLWKELLHAAEYVGQARALGTGVAASKQCSSVARIRLSYLISQLDGFRIKNSNSQMDQEIGQLRDTITERIMGTKPSVNAEEYFSLSSSTLDKIIVEFNNGLNQLKVS